MSNEPIVADEVEALRQSVERWSNLCGVLKQTAEKLTVKLSSETEENAKLRARVAELEGVIAAVVDDVSERTKAGMSWGLHGHPTMSPKSLFLLTSRARSNLGGGND